MGGGKKSKAPKAPDYAALQQSDALANRYTAQEITKWNRPTQIDAYGNVLSWTQDANGNWTQRQTLAPGTKAGQQYAQNAYNNAAYQASKQGAFTAPSQGNINYALTDLMNDKDFVNSAGAIKDFANTAGTIGSFDRTQGDKVAKDMYASALSRIAPDQAKSKESLDVKLRLQGLQPGTEAYNRAMKNEMTSQGDVLAKLGLDSTAAGYQAAQDIYNTNLGGQNQRFNQLLGTYGANLQGQNQRFSQAADTFGINSDQNYRSLQAALATQQQQYNQALQNYALPMERAQAAAQLYSGAPGPQWQGFSGATGYNPADMTGAAQASYQAKMGNANASAGKKNSMLGAGTSLGSAFLGSK